MWPHFPGDAKDVFKRREIILFITAVKVNKQIDSPFTVKILYLYNELDIKVAVLLKDYWVGYFHPKSCLSL